MPEKNRQSHMFGTPPPQKSETKRIVLMTVALVVVMGVFIYNVNQSAQRQEEQNKSRTTRAVPEVPVQLPAMRSAELDALVQDKTEAGRALDQPDALQLALDDASKLAASHYFVLDPPSLDAALSAELAADPSAWRLKALRLRGELRMLRERELPSGETYYTGSLRLDDGSPAHFAVKRLPDDITPNSWLRIDGLFVKLLRDELDGAWVDAPLVVSRLATESVAPQFPAGEPLELAADGVGTFTPAELPNVVNDELKRGIGYLPPVEKWKLLARAAREADAVDWDAAPVLDRETMDAIMADPSEWRGMPVRLPANGAALITSTSGPAEENPARLPEVTEGMLFEHAWKDSAQVAQFLYPGDLYIPGNDWNGDPTVFGKGFFFKHHTYENTKSTLSLAPLFVLAEIEPGEAPDNSAYTKLLYGVVALTGLLIVGIYLLLRREKKRSEEFQKRRLERMRQKRQAASAS